MKTGISVKVTNEKSENYGRQGVTIIVNAYHSMVEEFGTGKVFNESNRNLRSCAHITYANKRIESEVLSSVELWLRQWVADCDGTIEAYEPFAATNDLAAVKTEMAKQWKKEFENKLKQAK